MINSMLLVYVGNDISVYVTLTPSHFLLLNPKIGLPVHNCDDLTDSDFILNISPGEKLLVTWKKRLKQLDNFKKCGK